MSLNIIIRSKIKHQSRNQTTVIQEQSIICSICAGNEKKCFNHYNSGNIQIPNCSLDQILWPVSIRVKFIYFAQIFLILYSQNISRYKTSISSMVVRSIAKHILKTSMQNWKFDMHCTQKQRKFYFIGSKERHHVCFVVYSDVMIQCKRETLSIKKTKCAYCVSSNYYFDLNIYKVEHSSA